METIIAVRDEGALSLPASGPEERAAQLAERVARLAAVDPEQLVLAMHFLIGYQPRMFDLALDAVEPGGTGAGDTVEEEPYCLLCDAPVGIFPAHGPDYRHYKGALTSVSKPRPYKADHAPKVGWRRARDAESVMC